MLNNELIYLASPYSHPDSEVRLERVRLVMSATALLMKSQIVVYSPIVHNHRIAMDYGLPTEWEYWRQFDEVMISRCDELCVLMIDGWDKSKGVEDEIKIAQNLRKRIRYLNFEELDYIDNGVTLKIPSAYYSE